MIATVIETGIDILSAGFLAAGAFFYLVGAIGLNRMPDLFTRMHAASVSETLGLGLLLIGMLLQAGITLVAFKLLVIFALLFLTAPMASHALARAALHDGERPLLRGDDGRLRETGLEEKFPELEGRIERPLSSESPVGEARLPNPGAGEAEVQPEPGPAKGGDAPSNS